MQEEKGTLQCGKGAQGNWGKVQLDLVHKAKGHRELDGGAVALDSGAHLRLAGPLLSGSSRTM